MKLKTEISSWLMVLVIVVTAGITSWVMLKDKPSGNWNSTYYYPPQQVAQNFSPGIMAMKQAGILVAGTPGIPVIRVGSVPRHNDFGICTNCHRVVGSRGNPVPNISAKTKMHHDFRGVCTNCHQIVTVSTAGNAVQVAAAGPVVSPLSPALTTKPNTHVEGEWMGMEVAPITQLTANQYGIPLGTPGLVVSEAEIPAAAAGMKAGDVVQSVNNLPVNTMTDFFRATQNGVLLGGMVGILRQGQRMALNISQTANPTKVRRAKIPTEGEWMGMEVVPINQVTANQYGIPANTPGVAVAEVEVQAQAAGLKAGDVVQSINGIPVNKISDFFKATQGGNLAQGMLEILRKGKKLAVKISKKTVSPAAANPQPQVGNPALAAKPAGWRRVNEGVQQQWGPGAGGPRQF